MAGVGRFKLTDALPPQAERSPLEDSSAGTAPPKKGKAKSKSKGKSSGKTASSSASHSLAAEQLREARESKQAKNAEASVRDRMVDIGRGNQQAGRAAQQRKMNGKSPHGPEQLEFEDQWNSVLRRASSSCSGQHAVSARRSHGLSRPRQPEPCWWIVIRPFWTWPHNCPNRLAWWRM